MEHIAVLGTNIYLSSNPINPGLPFFGSTTSSRAFRPFKSKKVRVAKPDSKT